MDLAGYKPTLNEVAALVGTSSRWVSELRANGALPGDGATLREFVEAWAKHRSGEGKVKKADDATARLITAQADMAEMKAAQLRLSLLPRDEVTAAVQSAFSRVRAKLLSLPAKSAPIVVSMKSAVPIQEKLTELVHEALAELATTSIVIEEPTDPVDGSSQSPNGGSSGGLVASDDAAAEADGKPVGRRKSAAKPRGKRRTG